MIHEKKAHVLIKQKEKVRTRTSLEKLSRFKEKHIQSKENIKIENEKALKLQENLQRCKSKLYSKCLENKKDSNISKLDKKRSFAIKPLQTNIKLSLCQEGSSNQSFLHRCYSQGLMPKVRNESTRKQPFTLSGLEQEKMKYYNSFKDKNLSEFFSEKMKKKSILKHFILTNDEKISANKLVLNEKVFNKMQLIHKNKFVGERKEYLELKNKYLSYIDGFQNVENRSVPKKKAINLKSFQIGANKKQIVSFPEVQTLNESVSVKKSKVGLGLVRNESNLANAQSKNPRKKFSKWGVNSKKDLPISLNVIQLKREKVEEIKKDKKETIKSEVGFLIKKKSLIGMGTKNLSIGSDPSFQEISLCSKNLIPSLAKLNDKQNYLKNLESKAEKRLVQAPQNCKIDKKEKTEDFILVKDESQQVLAECSQIEQTSNEMRNSHPIFMTNLEKTDAEIQNNNFEKKIDFDSIQDEIDQSRFQNTEPITCQTKKNGRTEKCPSTETRQLEQIVGEKMNEIFSTIEESTSKKREDLLQNETLNDLLVESKIDSKFEEDEESNDNAVTQNFCLKVVIKKEDFNLI